LRHWFEQQCRRQTLGGLHHAKDELPGDAADLLVHAEGADVIVDRALSVDTHGGEVVEDDGQVAVDQRSDLFGQFDLDPLDMVHQRVHGAQEMLVGHGRAWPASRRSPASAGSPTCCWGRKVD